ncbi:MAG: hypothetical protein QOD39_4719 [Mycobacterium sp.]|nr:hypothetical protein [Mycobacterium sp.]
MRTPARGLAAALEPFAGQVYFAEECHKNYSSLGFAASPAKMGEVALPDGSAYFCSRGSVMGQVPGEVVSAAFGVFNPAVVVPAVAYGWTLTDAATIEKARTDGAVAQLRRILGDEPDGLARALDLLQEANSGLRPEGRALFAGLLSQEVPDSPLGEAWRLADQLREYRGDSHIAVWLSSGFDATEIGLLSELYWGLPMRTYVRSRAWSAADLDAAEGRLVELGLIADGAFTGEGRAARERIEIQTDQACEPIVANLGPRLGELVRILSGWSAAIRAAGGYPQAGPHDLAGLVEHRTPA